MVIRGVPKEVLHKFSYPLQSFIEMDRESALDLSWDWLRRMNAYIARADEAYYSKSNLDVGRMRKSDWGQSDARGWRDEWEIRFGRAYNANLNAFLTVLKKYKNNHIKDFQTHLKWMHATVTATAYFLGFHEEEYRAQCDEAGL